MPAAKQNSENDNARVNDILRKQILRQHNPKGMINDHPRSLKVKLTYS